jgi:hypothetical protein
MRIASEFAAKSCASAGAQAAAVVLRGAPVSGRDSLFARGAGFVDETHNCHPRSYGTSIHPEPDSHRGNAGQVRHAAIASALYAAIAWCLPPAPADCRGEDARRSSFVGGGVVSAIAFDMASMLDISPRRGNMRFVGHLAMDVPASAVVDGAAPPPISTGMRVSYGLGSIAFGIGGVPLSSSLLMLYFNQVIGVEAVLVGIAIMVSVSVDAFTDPLIGWVSDRLRAPFGVVTH